MPATHANGGASLIGEARTVSKSFPCVKALDGVNVAFRAGEVHAVVGANGAGKSTLIGLFAGLRQADGGTLAVNGHEVSFRHPFEAIQAGVSVIHQELTVLANLSVAENIFLGNLPTNKWGLVDHPALLADAREILDRLELDLDPTGILGDLPVGARQMVEIAKALSRDAQLIFMDEPTSSLGPHEAARLFRIVRLLRDQGRAVVYVSHKLDEILALADRITVLRDGTRALCEARGVLDETKLIDAMVGGVLAEPSGAALDRPRQPLMEVAGLTRKGAFEDISLTLHGGEILGLAGLVGAGRSDLARALFGAEPVDSGTISLDGQSKTFRDPTEAIEAGLALVPENRQADGVVLEMSVLENLVLSQAPALAKCRILDRAGERELAMAWIERLSIRATNADQKVATLSGGNQQKVALGRCLALAPRILIIDEPTRGVDVAAKAEIHHILRRAAADGMAILMISSETDELLTMCDRIGVMRAGRLVAVIGREDATEHVIAAHTLGMDNDA